MRGAFSCLNVVFRGLTALGLPTVDLTSLFAGEFQSHAVSTGIGIWQEQRAVFYEYFFDSFLLLFWQGDNAAFKFSNFLAFDACFVSDIPGRNTHESAAGSGKV